MKHAIAASAAILFILTGCKGNFTRGEKALIRQQDSTMRVLAVDRTQDSLFLRQGCLDFSRHALRSADYAALCRKMVATVTSPEQDGVGIAGPQVGIARRIVAVQRFDKDGEPFIVYPNISIIERRGEKEYGPEGCLSVPGRRGEVARWRDITIAYTSPATLHDTTEAVTGFTAVIFQHETDHLDGVLYTDYL